MDAPDPAFHLIVHDDERAVLRLALEVYRDDFGRREHLVTVVADRVMGHVDALEGTSLALSEADMKVTWSALHSLLDDSRREQESDRAHLHALLERLPGETDMRMIDLESAVGREG